ncbi:MAG TPA: prolyl oligopeptidase family serine peptidase, partial [Planctomycetota bacterium]|nr:prolyl oligopeptidase family serine peptidase [Planctomycetota bacterium]
DRTHRMFLRVAPATGATEILHHDEDPAWVLGRAYGFVGTGATFAFTAERDGWMHPYVLDVATGAARRLGPGGYEAEPVWWAPDGSFALGTGAPDGPHARELLRWDVVSGGVERLTHDGGLRALVVSPDGARFAEVRSKPAAPWELWIGSVDQPGAAKRVTASPSTAFLTWDGKRTPEIVQVESEGGCVPARIYRPADGRRGGPGVVFIHGAGYLQNVHDGWSQYQREYAFHHFLAERGYTTLDVDYRGSAGYGRAFRAAVKGRVGELDALDVVACAKHLVEVEGCDPARIHCYGGSYGGFLTLMALFRHPGVFRSGAALRPVTDWAHYHEGYTANLLDDPLDDAETYRRASPITWASGLRDRLLICHGLLDDNVLPQDTVRLTQRLIELRKTNFEVMLYPCEPHAFVDAASWSDEYRRIFETFER